MTNPTSSSSTKKTNPRDGTETAMPRNTATHKPPPHKVIYLIRHGKSLGQCAQSNKQRKYDRTLLDCGLCRQGFDEARNIPHQLGADAYNSIELVVSSPLTRALQTAVVAFMDTTTFVEVERPLKPIVVHYDLREVGSALPENIPRSTRVVQQDLVATTNISINNNNNTMIDFESLRPEEWPLGQVVSSSSKADHRQAIQQAFAWLAVQRPERTFAVVCHYAVIQTALNNYGIRPQNAIPIKCHLYPDGRLDLVEDDERESIDWLI